MRFEKPVLQIEYVLKRHGRYDVDNWQTRFKSGLDALVKLEILQDDNSNYLTVLPLIFTIDPKRAPQTIIRIKEANDAR